VRFRYKVLRSSAGGKNLALFAIAVAFRGISWDGRVDVT
jgi:hypothetical protein